jgi:hypothetical protein
MLSDLNSGQSSSEIDSRKCEDCQGTAQPGYKLALCPHCRQKFAKKPIPLVIKITGLAVLVASALALTRLPASMLGAIAFERGQRDEAQSDYNGASIEYRKAADAFPDATLPIARLGIVRYRSGDPSGAARIFSYLAGRKSDPNLTAEVNGVINKMEREIQ